VGWHVEPDAVRLRGPAGNFRILKQLTLTVCDAMTASSLAHEPTSHATPPLPPAVAAALQPASSLEEAQRLTRNLAHHHYENFTVVSSLLPRHLRQDFCNVYAFCRIADDLGDEVHDTVLSLQYLAQFREQTRACYRGEPRNAVFTALSSTIARHDIPIQPFLDLIDAFEQDQRVRRYQTFDEVLDYCRRSANPVGRIVLYVCGYRDEQRQRLSDQTCTALQLANFWQDVRRDIVELNRVYLPLESLRRFGVSEDQLHGGQFDERFREMLKFEVDRTAAMFDEGEKLLPMLDPAVRGQIRLFGQGGRAILEAIRRQDYDTLSRRPTLTAWQKGRLVLLALAAKLAGTGRAGRRRVAG
jgi:squalene synthase HpnC